MYYVRSVGERRSSGGSEVSGRVKESIHIGGLVIIGQIYHIAALNRGCSQRCPEFAACTSVSRVLRVDMVDVDDDG